MSLDTLADAFYDELCDIYHAEKQLLKALPKMAKKASSAKLASAFEAHLAETEEQVGRVEAAFEDTGKAAKAKKCEAMAGLIEEASEMMKEDAEPEVMDAVLISCAKKSSTTKSQPMARSAHGRKCSATKAPKPPWRRI